MFYQITLENLEREVEDFHQNALSHLPFFIETGELLRFAQEAKERVRHFYTLITRKHTKVERKHNQVNLKLTQDREILNYAQHQDFEADDVLLSIVTKENQKLEANKKRLSELTTEVKKVQEIKRLMDQKFKEIFEQSASRLNQIVQVRYQEQGLTPRRIRRFQVFTADETHVGDQCSICMEDIDVGRNMIRLTCDGQHYFCQECIERWFADHNTCPLCRHKFD